MLTRHRPDPGSAPRCWVGRSGRRDPACPCCRRRGPRSYQGRPSTRRHRAGRRRCGAGCSTLGCGTTVRDAVDAASRSITSIARAYASSSWAPPPGPDRAAPAERRKTSASAVRPSCSSGPRKVAQGYRQEGGAAGSSPALQRGSVLRQQVQRWRELRAHNQQPGQRRVLVGVVRDEVAELRRSLKHGCGLRRIHRRPAAALRIPGPREMAGRPGGLRARQRSIGELDSLVDATKVGQRHREPAFGVGGGAGGRIQVDGLAVERHRLVKLRRRRG